MSKDEILEGLGGCKNIIENDRHCRVTVIENDTKIHKEYEIKKLRDIQYKIKGRGGTTLQPGLERCRELRTDVTLCFTDAACDNINEVPRKLLPKKIIWVVNSDNVSMIDKTGFIVRIN
jgi:predicted metal-dependent peptidase